MSLVLTATQQVKERAVKRLRATTPQRIISDRDLERVFLPSSQRSTSLFFRDRFHAAKRRPADNPKRPALPTASISIISMVAGDRISSLGTSSSPVSRRTTPSLSLKEDWTFVVVPWV